MAALEDVLDKDPVYRFLIEHKHTYEELVTEIKISESVDYERSRGFVITKESEKEC